MNLSRRLTKPSSTADTTKNGVGAPSSSPTSHGNSERIRWSKKKSKLCNRWLSAIFLVTIISGFVMISSKSSVGVDLASNPENYYPSGNNHHLGLHEISNTLSSKFYTKTFTATSGKRLRDNITITSKSDEHCRKNAIVILAQKKHSTYDRDSYGLLIKSLKLLSKNYLSRGNYANNVDVFLFHTGDFDLRDIEILEPILLDGVSPSLRKSGIIKLVNLNDSVFWMLPPWHRKDNQKDWALSDVFPVGYRHMCRWFGVNIWQFFEQLNSSLNCQYKHLLRIDEDSFILSPINYDIFDYMKHNNFVYGFRMCAYELDYNRFIAPWFNQWKRKTPVKREITKDLCGLYNNFFVADLDFFTSPPVRKYLKEIDRQGFIYRKRYGDLMIHSTAVYAFGDNERIHRFLDFTYQHVTTDHILHPQQACVVWGGIQAGYNDMDSERILAEYYQEHVVDKDCTTNMTYMEGKDLSPTYQHVPAAWRDKLALKTFYAGRVELPNQGILSG